MKVRKISLTKETIFADAGRPAAQPVTRAYAVAVIDNPFAGHFVGDLSPLFAQGAELGQMLMKDLVALLPRPPISYGKAAIVGLSGEIEHGAAVNSSPARKTHSGRGRRRRGDHLLKRQDRRTRHVDRRAARP